MEDTFRVRLLVPSAPGSGAALRQGLRASSRRSHRPTGKSKRQKRTHEWIKLGGKVSHDRLECEEAYFVMAERGCEGMLINDESGEQPPGLWRDDEACRPRLSSSQT